LQAKNEQLEFDLEMMRRNVDSNNMSKDVLNKKEEDLLRELNQVQEVLREKDFELESNLNEIGRLRN